MRASTQGLAILYPLRWRMGSTAPSVAGFRNLFECQLVASGPVSASPSPTTQHTMRSGLSNAAPYAWARAYPSSPPSWIEPGVSGATWLGMPPGNENWVNSRLDSGEWTPVIPGNLRHFRAGSADNETLGASWEQTHPFSQRLWLSSPCHVSPSAAGTGSA